MKKIIFLALSIFTIHQASAKIWRVNNFEELKADFTDAQAAIDAASIGDTILFEQSPISYGSITIEKQLVLLGAGYFLSDNYPKGNSFTAQLDYINVGNIYKPATGGVSTVRNVFYMVNF
ncbi:hypothetical protein [Flammeovirga sp. SJP92]|uniref:hypothetical protein n=1 Tax=Flammeovirga sp. SJP92 TaxID=1775430 RepID=UPI000786C04F|nr:hypothetical protein [Flammeovirga sp. SJP92]KXX67918.1 hypothetical protein AVL50_23970 [Flammeovirga sp. SJP92]